MALKGRRILYISYNGMLDPLGQSQVIPYLKGLSKVGVRFTLLSFERPAAFKPEAVKSREKVKQELAAHHIEWYYLRYHRRPSLPVTTYDVGAGVHCGTKLVQRNAIHMVHARNPIMATIALRLKRRLGVKMIFDVRGLLADEYVDAGHWRARSLKYRLTKTMERRCLAASDGVVTLTETIWPIIRDWDGLRGREVPHEVIPCCADLNRFRFDPEARKARRAELELNGKLIFVYSGSIGGWYLTGRMADFFAVLLRERGNAHLLWLTPGNPDPIRKIMHERGIAAESYTIRSADWADVPSYLSASDAGLAFIKPCFSKRASSPTKIAEYLGCGLPIIINAGIGDSDEILAQEKVGVLLGRFTEEEYRRVATAVTGLIKDVEATRSSTRAVAERLFDVQSVGVQRYARLYEKVLAGNEPSSSAANTRSARSSL
jgi:glycosyltransferase involved in cell wall biosynthesis